MRVFQVACSALWLLELLPVASAKRSERSEQGGSTAIAPQVAQDPRQVDLSDAGRIRVTLDRLAAKLRGCPEGGAFAQWRKELEVMLRRASGGAPKPAAGLWRRLVEVDSSEDIPLAEQPGGRGAWRCTARVMARLRALTSALANGLGDGTASRDTPPSQELDSPPVVDHAHAPRYESTKSFQWIDTYVSTSCSGLGKSLWSEQQSCFRRVADEVPKICIGAVDLFRNLPGYSDRPRMCDDTVREFRRRCALTWPDVADCRALYG